MFIERIVLRSYVGLTLNIFLVSNEVMRNEGLALRTFLRYTHVYQTLSNSVYYRNTEKKNNHRIRNNNEIILFFLTRKNLGYCKVIENISWELAGSRYVETSYIERDQRITACVYIDKRVPREFAVYFYSI